MKRWMVGVGLTLGLGLVPASAKPPAPVRLPRVAVADFAVVGAGEARSWLGPLYGMVLAQRLRGCLEILLTEPQELRPFAPVTQPQDVAAVGPALVYQARATRAAYAIGGLIEDRGATVVVTTVVAPAGAGKPLPVTTAPGTLDNLFRPQIDVVVGRFMAEMGVKLSPQSFKAMTEYTPQLTLQTMPLVGKGWRVYSDDNPEPAFTLWRQARDLDPKCDLANEALAQTGLVYRQRLQEQALRFYRRQVNANPRDPIAHYHLAGVLLEQANYVEAGSEYRQSVELRQNFVEGYLGWGVALLQQGMIEPAMTKFEAVLVLEPENRKALFNKGLACYQHGHAAAARTMWNRVLQLYPDDPQARAAINRLGDQTGAPGAVN